MFCEKCEKSNPVIITSYDAKKLCKQCFITNFEETIHQTITTQNIFIPNTKVCIGMSGGKDSTVLAYVLNKLNNEKNYQLDLHLLAIDEGISGYRDNSLEMVYLNQKELNLPLTVLSYKELYETTMDEMIFKTGKSNACTKCGTFRRHALEIGALKIQANSIATGHNLDDIAETVLMNLFRGDINKLKKCTLARTSGKIARCKPFKFTYQKEIVMYAFYKNLKYFSTECIYSPGNYRGEMRIFIKKIEKINKKYIHKIVESADDFQEEDKEVYVKCERCNILSKGVVCQACILKETVGKL